MEGPGFDPVFRRTRYHMLQPRIARRNQDLALVKCQDNTKRKYGYTSTEYAPDIKKTENSAITTMWIDIEVTMLSEISQAEEKTNAMLLLML